MRPWVCSLNGSRTINDLFVGFEEGGWNSPRRETMTIMRRANVDAMFSLNLVSQPPQTIEGHNESFHDSLFLGKFSPNSGFPRDGSTSKPLNYVMIHPMVRSMSWCPSLLDLYFMPEDRS
ncbi:hypothetical protein HAX54_033261 [Datura stramonium]|uniref:Uncharacterized protein n=1 Tax=Datura stramonium TaxID=4076 RepID=A0ABS8VET4_DATST|nr:hypothetical protein [Datura stramonium]